MKDKSSLNKDELFKLFRDNTKKKKAKEVTTDENSYAKALDGISRSAAFEVSSHGVTWEGLYPYILTCIGLAFSWFFENKDKKPKDPPPEEKNPTPIETDPDKIKDFNKRLYGF